jgi:hypothetical protein
MLASPKAFRVLYLLFEAKVEDSRSVRLVLHVVKLLHRSTTAGRAATSEGGGGGATWMNRPLQVKRYK